MKFTIDQVKEAVEVNFNADYIEEFKEYIVCDFDDEVAPRVRIVLVNDETKYRFIQGLHLQNLESETDLDFEIGQALNECFRSGWNNIWIHQ